MEMRKMAAVGLVLSMLASGCANQQGSGANYRPIVDRAGVDSQEYNKDLRQCQQYARETMNAQQGAAAGAVAGAIFGALLGAALGDSDLAARSAGAGALGGAAGGAGEGEKNQRTIIRRCLQGRGYNVLN